MKKKIKQIFAEFLEKLLIFEPKIKIEENEGLFELRLDCEEPGRLIGKNGETLQALELILRLMINKEFKESVNISLDIAGYKDKRRAEIEKAGERAAESAKRTGQIQVLLPMNAYERRLIHLALKDRDDLETESIGEEPNRRVMIKVKKKELV